jgi:hypothetical protein
MTNAWQSRVCTEDPFNKLKPGLQGFSCYNLPKREKYQMNIKIYKICIPNGRKIVQRAKKFDIFHFKILQNLPNLGLFVLKHAIWQPWLKPIRRNPSNVYISDAFTQIRSAGPTLATPTARPPTSSRPSTSGSTWSRTIPCFTPQGSRKAFIHYL